MARKQASGEPIPADLVELLLECNVTEDALSPMLSRLGRQVGSHLGLLADFRPADDHHVGFYTFGASAQDREAWLGRYSTGGANPLIRAAVSSGATLLTSEMMPGKREIGHTAFWKEVIEHFDAERWVGTIPIATPEVVCHFSLYRSGRLSGFHPAAKALTEKVVPYVRVAAQVRSRLRAALAERAAALETLDRLSLGVCLLDARGRERHSNKAAERMFSAGDGLGLQHHELRCSEPRESRALQAAVAKAAVGAAGGDPHPGTALTVSRPSGKRPYRVLVAPLLGSRLSSCVARCAALVLVTDPEVVPASQEQTLRSLYGLTGAEVRVATALNSGENLRQVAERLGIGYTTARTHLARALQKTGARRQSELVMLLQSVVA